jgi:uncharacterized protein YdhG (YjbR/CyaY superfamily)
MAKLIDDYIKQFDPSIQKILAEIRYTIQKSAPGAQETIRYGIPTFQVNDKNLVHFAAFKSHVGFYPTPSGIEAYKEELSKYKGAKGSVQFPINEPIPYKLISDITKYRFQQVSASK